jgi:hypothetical protein
LWDLRVPAAGTAVPNAKTIAVICPALRTDARNLIPVRKKRSRRSQKTGYELRSHTGTLALVGPPSNMSLVGLLEEQLL